MEAADPLFALKNLIDAQQQVITSWEQVFGSVESTIINLVKKNLELKLRLIRQINPDASLPVDVYRQMDAVRAKYTSGSISPLEYFVYIDTLLTELEL
ncbi:hypothetical protein [Mucilaginibacter paludis]|uniref:Uncharacterized protein n=1 Tax=Mucilaginibacter paludis DSM 18603 TaxID=714943 RepID=H1Y9G3_9SPHI|nr:hypothetical protein [Mucilaginibacter paludis]EHQ29968.1 hypothetical protein Mucpa_5903 [Mucilaginibacter paludis DSM 18603]